MRRFLTSLATFVASIGWHPAFAAGSLMLLGVGGPGGGLSTGWLSATTAPVALNNILKG